MAYNSFFANPPANPSTVSTNTGGLFGLSQNTNTTQNTGNTTTPSLFGNTSTTTNSAPNPQQPQTQPSLFGNINTNNTGTNANLNQTTTTTNTGGGGLFGGQQTQQPGNIFGNITNPTNPTSVGSTTTTSTGGTGGGLFGTNTNANTNNTNNTNPGGGGSIFGLGANTNTNTSNNQQQQGTTGTTTGSSLFSNPFSQLQQPQQQSQQQQQQPSLTSSNLFSTNNTNTGGGGGIFGLGANTNTSTSNNPQGTAGTTTGSSLFTNLFSQQQQQPQQQQQQQQPLSTSNLFSSRPNTLSSTTGVGTGGVTQLEAQEQFLKISQGVETIYQAWNPASKNCRFQHIFYNLVDPKQVSLYGRPSNATNDALWEKAVRENPDPTCLVPVIAVGFDDLRERANAQSTQSSSQLQKLTDLSNRLKSFLTEHSISNSSRLQRAHNSQTQLIQRLMRLVQHLHLLIPAVRSSSIRVEEEELRSKLEEMEEELKRSRVKGKLNEMWALLGAVGAFMERGRGDGQGGQGEWAVVDDEGLAQITQILAEQQAGLQHLTKILQKDQKDLAIIMGSGTAGGDDGYLANEVENMWSSTNASLRSSRLR